jgi:flagellar biosynthetic protein FliQ
MTDVMVMQICKQALIVALELSLPILVLTLAAGLAMSIFQSVTQVQEFTLTFIPKVLAAILAFAVFGPWMLRIYMDFASQLFINLSTYVK